MQTVPAASVLWEANVRTQPFRAKVEAAAAGGFVQLTVPIRIFRQEISDGRSAREMSAIAGDAGVSLEFLDGMSGWAPIRCPSSAEPWLRSALAHLDIDAEECLDICDALGMKNIVAISAFDIGDLPLSQMVDAFAHFCDQAQARGMWVDLEFIPMLGIPDLSIAWEIVRQADRKNSGILFDTWHFMRGRPDFDLLRAIPAERIVNIQLADASSIVRGANLWEDAHRYRLPPGEGELPIVQMLEILEHKGSIRSIGPEVFSEELGRLSPREAGRRLADATNSVASKSGLPVEFGATRYS